MDITTAPSHILYDEAEDGSGDTLITVINRVPVRVCDSRVGAIILPYQHSINEAGRLIPVYNTKMYHPTRYSRHAYIIKLSDMFCKTVDDEIATRSPANHTRCIFASELEVRRISMGCEERAAAKLSHEMVRLLPRCSIATFVDTGAVWRNGFRYHTSVLCVRLPSGGHGITTAYMNSPQTHIDVLFPWFGNALRTLVPLLWYKSEELGLPQLPFELIKYIFDLCLLQCKVSDHETAIEGLIGL